MRPEEISGATFRELAHRVDGGVEVKLLWSARENRLAVTVLDEPAGKMLVLDAESDRALDVFYHPYAHASRQATAGLTHRDPGGISELGRAVRGAWLSA